MKWPPWSWALRLTWLNQPACGLVVNARTRSSARFGQLAQAPQVRKRLQDLTRQAVCLVLTQLPEAPAQGGQLSGAGAAGLGLGQHGG